MEPFTPSTPGSDVRPLLVNPLNSCDEAVSVLYLVFLVNGFEERWLTCRFSIQSEGLDNGSCKRFPIER